MGSPARVHAKNREDHRERGPTGCRAAHHQHRFESPFTDAIVRAESRKSQAKLNDRIVTAEEVAQIKSVVDRAGRPLWVVGSAARGTRRGVGTNLPVGKGPGTRSDIDYTTANSSVEYFEEVAAELPSLGEAGLLRGSPDGKAIRFEPGSRPYVMTAAEEEEK